MSAKAWLLDYFTRSYRNGSIAQHDHERDILFSLRMPESVFDIAVFRPQPVKI
jgi:hypothetical protein